MVKDSPPRYRSIPMLSNAAFTRSIASYTSELPMAQEPVIYFDVDDTLVRSASTKRIPIPAAIASVRALKQSGVRLFLWSTGGADYARSTAEELGLVECFEGFLPK